MTNPGRSSDDFITADINFFPKTGTPIPASAWKTRYLGVPEEFTKAVQIHNMRKSVKKFELNVHGFEYVTLPQRKRVDGNSTEEEIVTEYYPEIEEVVKKIIGATAIHPFNHVIRAHSSPSAKGIQNSHGRWQEIPSAHPHVDYAGDSASLAGTLAELSFPAPIAALFTTSQRFSFLNVWRPLKPVRRDPLAVCDATTVPDEDYQVRMRKFSRTGIESSNYVMSWSEGQEWWYCEDMREWEVVVFKGLDSRRDGAWRCPHTAVEMPDGDGAARESIEVRLVCFWEQR